MIKYSLDCATGCRFEAWFPNSAACDEQLTRGIVACPECGCSDVTKALMAPSIATHRKSSPDAIAAAPQPAETEAPPTPPAEPSARQAAEPTADDVAPSAARRHAVELQLRALRAYVEANADHVGAAFATEARRIHEGDAEARNIYGDATREEIDELVDEGVPIAAVPWIDRADD